MASPPIFPCQLILVITDGSSTGGIINLRSAVDKLKSMKVNIISIGIGPRLNRAELQMMASDPKESHVFFIRNAGELNNLLQSLVKTSCQGKKQVPANLQAFPRVIAFPNKVIIGK